MSKRRAARGVGCGKTGTMTIENRERHKRVAEKDLKDQAKNAACGKAKTNGQRKKEP